MPEDPSPENPSTTSIEKADAPENPNSGANSADSEVIQGVPVELLEKLPPEIRKQIVSFSMDHRYIGPAPNPIVNKINEKHIDKILDLSEKDEERAFQSDKASRRYYLLYIVLALSFLVFLTIYLPAIDKELYKDVLKVLIGLLGGFGAGFGVGQVYSKKKRD